MHLGGFCNEFVDRFLTEVDAEVESEGAGVSGSNPRNPAVFTLNFAVEGVAGGGFDSRYVPIFFRRGIFPNGEVREFRDVPANRGGLIPTGIGE